MREIKFRIWDNANKCWMYWEYEHASKNFVIKLPKNSKPPLPIGDIYEFTGLKDKKGKEIYEGDIMEFEEENRKEKVYIKFDKGLFIVIDTNESFDETARYIDILSELEDWKFAKIIGNIYENPELLKEVKKNGNRL